uniref:Uncharacterized protein n=1 Tax=Alexandrium andersonii TaxID=327968 RepID=A0A7S2D013_9DINO
MAPRAAFCAALLASALSSAAAARSSEIEAASSEVLEAVNETLGAHSKSETAAANPSLDEFLSMLSGRWAPSNGQVLSDGQSTRIIEFNNEISTARGREWDFMLFKNGKQKAYASFFANQCERTMPFRCRIGQHPKLLEYMSGGWFGGTYEFKVYFRHAEPGVIEVNEGELCAYGKPCLTGWHRFYKIG